MLEEVESRMVQESADRVELRARINLSSNDFTTGFDIIYHYMIKSDGRIEINVSATPHGRMTHWLPRAGLQLQLPRNFQEMDWHGRGPF